MLVRDLLKKKNSGVITIEPDRDLATAARLLIQHDIGGLPVATHDGELVGFLAERDVVRILDGRPAPIRGLPVEQAMRRPAPVCAGTDSLLEVMNRMTRLRLRHLVVMEGERIEGVISVGDLVKQRLEELETETGVLRDYVAAHRAAS